jgi:hypothetical protein
MISKAITVVNKTQFIKNMKYPACNDCFYYIQGKLKPSKCTKFGEKNVITGKIIYEDVSIVRLDDNLCGKKGNYYEVK